MRADLTFLTADSLQGRLSLAPGDQVAIDWIASEFLKAGTEMQLQPVPLIEYRVDRAASHLTINGKRHTVSGASTTKDVELRAPVVFAGFGDYTGLDVKGKIVLLFEHEANESEKGQSLAGQPRAKILAAATQGAVAVMIMPDPGRKHPTYGELTARRPRTSTVNQSIASQMLEEKAAIPQWSISEAAGMEILTAAGHDARKIQTAIEAGTRPSAFPLRDPMAEVVIKLQDRKEAVSHNVVGILRGSDPQLKQEAVLFTAHHDHNGRVGQEMMPGADDNGSGTVAVIELARLFGSAKERPKRTLVFIVFTAEERGLLGAYHYVNFPLIPLAATRAVINFDMVGRNETHTEESKGLVNIAPDTSNELNLIGCKFHRQYCEIVERANKNVGLRINAKWDRDVTFNVLRRSDHFPFLMKSIPAAWWFTGFHPDYHQPSDTVEKINFEKLAKIVNLAYLSGRDMANGAMSAR